MESHVAADRERRERAARRVVPAERYPWLVLASLVCLLAALAVGSAGGEGRTR